jgi:cytochrome P450
MPAMGADVPTFDPQVDGFFDDPYAHYAELRAENPIHADHRGVVFFFRFDDVRKVLIDPRSTSMDRVRALPPRRDGTPREAPPTFPLSILNRDPPDHTRLRRLLNPSFTQRGVEELVAWMDGQVDKLLDDVEAEHQSTGQPVDLITGLAFSFPFRVISQLLGMPDWDDTQVRTWAHAIRSASDPVVSREQLAASIAAYEAINAYVLEEVIPWKREHPADDLLSRLIAAEGDGAIATDELLDNVALLYVAGHETTTGLIGNGILSLLRNRGELERLRSDPALLPNAIDELNRYDSSVQFAWRYVIDELPVGDFTLAAGSMAFVSCGSANRDPAHFGADADRLDLGRSDARDLMSYGAGMHFCLGAHLARREAALVIGKLLERFPDVALASDPSWGQSMTFRSVEHLPVVLGESTTR